MLCVEVFYNFGNMVYCEGKLKEVIDYYMLLFDLNLDDEDVKFNFEFVCEEIKCC